MFDGDMMTWRVVYDDGNFVYERDREGNVKVRYHDLEYERVKEFHLLLIQARIKAQSHLLFSHECKGLMPNWKKVAYDEVFYSEMNRWAREKSVSVPHIRSLIIASAQELRAITVDGTLLSAHIAVNEDRNTGIVVSVHPSSMLTFVIPDHGKLLFRKRTIRSISNEIGVLKKIYIAGYRMCMGSKGEARDASGRVETDTNSPLFITEHLGYVTFDGKGRFLSMKFSDDEGDMEYYPFELFDGEINENIIKEKNYAPIRGVGTA